MVVQAENADEGGNTLGVETIPSAVSVGAAGLSASAATVVPT
jgi:hypothetical protein